MSEDNVENSYIGGAWLLENVMFVFVYLWQVSVLEFCALSYV